MNLRPLPHGQGEFRPTAAAGGEERIRGDGSAERRLRGQSWNSEFKLLIPRLIQVSRHCTNEVCTYDVDLRDRQLSADWNTATPDTFITRGGP